VQLLVIGFEGGEFRGDIRAELDRLREQDIVRLIDLMFVRKDDSGNVEAMQQSDLAPAEMQEFGALVGGLIGLGAGGEEGAEQGAAAGAAAAEDGSLLDDEDVWFAADAIPPGTAAAVALIEHRWAIPLRDAVRQTGGFRLADAWIHPADLVAIGLLAREEAAAY
jgi:uncharacterized membrane protein